MQKSESLVIELHQLRIGMFVELDVGWMAHPFPSGSFKITSQKQIDTLKALGLPSLRMVPSKSEVAELVEASALDAVFVHTPAPTALKSPVDAQQKHARQLEQQQRSLVVCERRFAESARHYRKTVDLLAQSPKEAAAQCQTMVKELVTELLEEGDASIRLLTEAAGDKVAMHPVNVTVLSLLLGKALGLHANELQDLGTAAFLHDIGKVQLPERVRHPDEHFSPVETRMYQEHVALGVQAGKRMELSKEVVWAIGQHHELANGTGFPAQVRAESMTTLGRILALINRYDNLCNPAKPSAALTPHEALALIFAQLKAQFHEPTLSAFIRMMGVYPPGSVVQLIDDRFGMVVSVNAARPLKPRLIVHDRGVPRHEALILDLERSSGLGIRRSVRPSQLPDAAMDYLAPRQRIGYFFDKTQSHVLEPVA
jgi:putative nucleotidyltransferase with HDIG domain